MKLKRLWRTPDNLGEYGKQHWQETGALLVSNEILFELDKGPFELLCIAYNRVREAEALMQEQGIVISGAKEGTTKQHPALAVWKGAMDVYGRLCKHFGLSPLSRGEKITIKEKPKKGVKDVNRFFK